MNEIKFPSRFEILKARNTHDFIEIKELRELLKSELGLNCRKVTVRGKSSLAYVVITVRDPSVDVAKVREFAKSLYTWSMDQTDYCSGQSIDVQTTPEVDAAHAAPFIEEITEAVRNMKGDWARLSTGQSLFRSHQGYSVSNGQNRGTYVYAPDVDLFKLSSITRLALQMARNTEIAA